jgi:hypothetical protein
MPGGTMLQQWKTDAKTHLRPSSVTFGDTFSQREKAFGLHRTKGFSLWEKLSPKVTDEGRGTRPQYQETRCENVPTKYLPWGEGGAAKP